MRVFTLLLLLALGACVSAPKYPFAEHNCDGFRQWILDLQAAKAPAHTVYMFWEPPDEDNIPIYAAILSDGEFTQFISKYSRAIAQQTHYKLFPEYVRGAAYCFGAEVLETPYGVKTLISFDRSSLVIESTNKCGETYADECDYIAMTYIPPAGAPLKNKVAGAKEVVEKK